MPVRLTREEIQQDMQDRLEKKRLESMRKIDRMERELKVREHREQERIFISSLREKMVAGDVPVDFEAIMAVIVAGFNGRIQGAAAPQFEPVSDADSLLATAEAADDIFADA